MTVETGMSGINRRKLQERVRELSGIYIEADDDRPMGGGGAFGFPDLPRFIADILLEASSSGATAVLFQLIKTWVNSRNGRKLKVVIGDIEVEATQMKTDQFLKLVEAVQDIRTKEEIRNDLWKSDVFVNRD